MRKNKQILVDEGNGDCMRACLTGMLDLPNDPKLVPLSGAKDWWKTCQPFLKRFGMKLAYEQKACWREGYWMASVKSKNYGKGITHAIVMKGSKVIYDPSTKKRYKTGDDMLGEGVVVGGFFLEVTDASKLHKLAQFQKSRS